MVTRTLARFYISYPFLWIFTTFWEELKDCIKHRMLEKYAILVLLMYSVLVKCFTDTLFKR